MIAYAQWFNDARIQSYALTLLDAGAEVDVLCLEDPGPRPAHPRLRVLPLGRKYAGDSSLGHAASYWSFIRRARAAVRSLSASHRYDVIHVHNMPDCLVFAIPRSIRRTARLILDMHDVMIAGVLAKFRTVQKAIWYPWTWLQSWASARQADVLLCADHMQLEFLRRHGLRHPRAFVYLNLPDSRWFRRRPPKPLGDPIRFVYHGSITRRSGLDLAVEAIGQIRRERSVTLTLIGGGDLRPELEECTRREGTFGQVVFFKDFIPVERLYDEIATYDVGVVANRRTLMSQFCMLPVKLMEYLRIGLPVIVPDLPVIRRYVSPDMVEFFRPDDATDLAQAMRRLLARASEWPRMIAAADRFFETYSEAQQKAMYLNLCGLQPTEASHG
jgi:glycosyltransferase involved in cell wall biosynthesis